jgi:hypothetical protein
MTGGLHHRAQHVADLIVVVQDMYDWLRCFIHFLALPDIFDLLWAVYIVAKTRASATDLCKIERPVSWGCRCHRWRGNEIVTLRGSGRSLHTRARERSPRAEALPGRDVGVLTTDCDRQVP